MKNKFKFIYILSFFLFIFLSSLYIFQIINYTKESYLVQSYEQEREDVFKEALSYTSFTSPSLNKVEIVAESMDFKPVKDVSYVNVSGRDIVAR